MMTVPMAGGALSRSLRGLRSSSLLLLVSMAILAFSLGRLVYNYVLFQSTIILLVDF
jgi:hypothetical protein